MNLSEVLVNLGIALALLITAWLKEQSTARKTAIQLGVCRLCRQPLPQLPNPEFGPQETPTLSDSKSRIKVTPE